MTTQNATDLIDRIVKVYDYCTPEEQTVLYTIMQELSEYGYSQTYEDVWLADYKEIPVDKKTFLTDPYYLGNSNNNGASIYPAWMDVMMELEQSGNQYYERVFTGATRTGKTSTAVSDAAYETYRLMCLRNPQEYFGLKAVTRISIFFFNITATLARGVAFKEFNTTLSVSPWFLEHGHFTQSEANPTYVPEGGLIEVTSGSDASHALGKATYLVIFDECNFAAAGIKDVNKSKERMKAKYDTLVARVTGTFVKNGEVFGKLYIISSKNSDSDFMEDYIQKQREAGNEHMYIFDKPQWEVWPASRYKSDKKFHIAIGGKNLRSFVVSDADDTPAGLKDLESQGYRIMAVPEDNKTRFLADFDIALRDIAGVSVPGMLSFITQETLDGCISATRKNPFYTDILSIGTKDNLTIEEYFHIDEVYANIRRCPIYIHIDLSLNTDRTGISGVAVTGRKDIETPNGKLSMPTFTHVFSISLEAPRGDKIPYSKITTFICWLRKSGFNIARISRDQFQSEYMAQLLEQQGFIVDKLSLDRTPDGYISLQSICLERRIDLLDYKLVQDELIHLQRDSVTGKIDHPVGGCFTGDTKVRLVDGRSLSIDELLVEQQYRQNWVYTYNHNTSKIEPKPIKKVFQTKLVTDLVEVELDNGEVIRCTPEHRFMLRDGQFDEAQNLTPGTSLMPLYTKVSDKGLVGYRLYYEPSEDKWHYEHRQLTWITGGVVSRYVKNTTEIPEGFRRGGTITEQAKKAQRDAISNMSDEVREHLRQVRSEDTSSRIWVTDGITDKYIKNSEDVPEGFYRGRTNHGRTHQVVDVRFIHMPCRVYDLEIVDNHNFALDAGVFVHNSKDTADSLAGATWNAEMNNTGIRLEGKSVTNVIGKVNGPRVIAAPTHQDAARKLPGMFNTPYNKIK